MNFLYVVVQGARFCLDKWKGNRATRRRGGEEEAGGRRGELREKEEGRGWHSDEDGQTDGQTNNVFI